MGEPVTADHCRICGKGTGNERYTVKEMMLGTRDPFEYFECGSCGTVQIADIPDDLGRYYPRDYYSVRGGSRLELFLKARWIRHSLDGRGALGRLLGHVYGPHPLAEWTRRSGMRRDSAILDVGCGDGRLLREMEGAGFVDLTGVDPYLDHAYRSKHLRVLGTDIHGLERSGFDCIMFHHTLEHLADPGAALGRAADLLAPGGAMIIRIPVASSHAWRTYRANWVQLDAPRHLHVLSEKAMNLLAEEADLRVSDVVYDSTAFQFWGSELYARDVPYAPKPSYRNRPSRKLIPKARMRAYGELARELNVRGDGDSACFHLREAGT
ncbi:MAG TPA: class I SAM-dependent methyltransferase [Longimicrobiales bacterium]|nr:class I SAM-dependent methyltransferase [Longimicrobiales bacterium]